MKQLRHLLCVVGLLLALHVQAYQRFFNLTYDEVRIDSLLPRFSFSLPLSGRYQDSIYQVRLLYPEYLDMSPADVDACVRKTRAPLGALPAVHQRMTVSRKQAALQLELTPLAFHEGRYRFLVGFMLQVEARPRPAVTRAGGRTKAPAPGERYAESSVLASGRWAKIRVPASGVYQLTDELARKAGFGDASRVRIYGYGGALQPEVLTDDYLRQTDDLHEVAQCVVDGRRLFYAQGPVSWSDKAATRRTRNPYSDYGCYFLTESDTPALQQDSTAFLSAFYPLPSHYHSLHEVDGFSWYHGGRNLFDTESVGAGKTKEVVIDNPQQSDYARLSVCVTAQTNTDVEVSLDGKVLGTLRVRLTDEYDHGNQATGIYEVGSLKASAMVGLRVVSGGPMRLDHVSMAWYKPVAAPRLTATFPSPEYVGAVANQNLHGDGPTDMVIVIPASRKLREQAERLKRFHEQHDELRVRIVAADELYNEFSSGTPDASAYKRYLKMLYDRASTEQDLPRYLLLMGDGLWDNRMLTSDGRWKDPADHLLCYESENSFNAVKCYVADDFYTLLDDGEQLTTADGEYSYGKSDLAVGRMPVTTPEEAATMVDKTIRYVENAQPGAWQNTLMFMGDDGNKNIHMLQANEAADQTVKAHPGFVVRKVMWDAYERVASSTRKTYPDAARLVKQQQQSGALIMDYAGHGIEYQLSDEAVLRITDFETFDNRNLPLWVTASCDIMPFDGSVPTIGETAVLNPKGGAFAFFGTTRTVYESYNRVLNEAYIKYVLGQSGGRHNTIGEAQRLAKIEMIETGQDPTINKLQYALLGDPAVRLNLPSCQVVVDSINGVAVGGESMPVLAAGAIARVVGHVEGQPDFKGIVSLTVRDSEEAVTCRMNNQSEVDTAFVFKDRQKTLYNGTDSIRGGRFAVTFAVPKDMNYSMGRGLINLFAADADRHLTGHGACEDFLVGGSAEADDDGKGPSLFCYLNTPQFENGGKVNATPLFGAELHDANGINASGSGIGHDLELVIDGDAEKTYRLNDHFQYDFGSYTRGRLFFTIPELSPGPHRLQFRAWDVLNNSTTTELAFEVVPGLGPQLGSIGVTDNPARTATTFLINHDRRGSRMEVQVEVFDVAGRLRWSHAESGTAADSSYRIGWDLRQRNGARVQPGIYIYRVTVGADGGKKASKAQKLIVVGNN